MQGQLSKPKVHSAVRDWAALYFQADDIVIYLFPDEDDEPERLIAILAVRGQEAWQAAEVWTDADEVASINPLGEGVPPDGVEWPWPEQDSRSRDGLTAVQRTILDCVQTSPGVFNRSELAKLLAGSRSGRLEGLIGHPYYGRLAGRGRKTITFDIDVLLQQGYLQVDGRDHIVPISPSR